MSIDTQLARIHGWADAVGAEVAEVVCDVGVSGSKPLADRVGGSRVNELMNARASGIDAIAVLRLDRLGRDAAETLALLKRFRGAKVGLVSVAERLDLATPHGRALAGVSAVFSELERSLIAQRTTEGLAELRRQGRPWNHPPLGWRVEGATLVPVDSEQLTIQRMHDLRGEGASYATVARALSAEGHATKRGGAWAAMTVRSALRAQPASP
jgi:DNA invertase Pin-like site-specific DNA recombinase